jgi:hypothetical protein
MVLERFGLSRTRAPCNGVSTRVIFRPVPSTLFVDALTQRVTSYIKLIGKPFGMKFYQTLWELKLILIYIYMSLGHVKYYGLIILWLGYCCQRKFISAVRIIQNYWISRVWLVRVKYNAQPSRLDMHTRIPSFIIIFSAVSAGCTASVVFDW